MEIGLKKITIIYTNKKISIKRKLENNLQWYDNIKQEMLYFKGGNLTFKYQEDPYLIKLGKEERMKRRIMSIWRMLPKVTDLKIKIKKNVINKDDIHTWFNNYVNYNDSNANIENINEQNIEISVPDNEIDDFIFGLDRNRFEYII